MGSYHIYLLLACLLGLTDARTEFLINVEHYLDLELRSSIPTNRNSEWPYGHTGSRHLGNHSQQRGASALTRLASKQ